MFLNKMKRVLVLAAFLFASNLLAASKVKVVTTLPDLQYIAEAIGGDRVDVLSLAKGYQDPHFVDAKPSLVLKLKNADVFIQVGLDLEVGWVPPLLQAARNSKIYYGGKGYVDASKGIHLLQIPTTSAAKLRAEGDIHVFGNPHYWLDPDNGKIIAKNILDAFKAIQVESADYFEKNYQTFSAKIDSAVQVWETKIAPYDGTKIFAYHDSWVYFEKRFGLEIVGFLEPKPGIPPTPSHLVSVIRKMQKNNIGVIIISPYYDDKPAQSIAKRTGAQVVAIASSVGAYPQIKSYFDLFDYNINALVDAIKNTK